MLILTHFEGERKKLKIVIDNSQLFRMICYKEIKTSRDNHFNRSINSILHTYSTMLV